MDRKQYEEKKEAVLRDWSARIDDLKKKADQSKADVKLKYYEQIETLRIKQENAKKRLRELKEAGGEKWESIKNSIEDALNDLKDSFNNTISKLRH